MTKKSVGYVHLEWECPACNTRNKGIDKICHNCAAAQPTDVKFEQVVQETLIEDERVIAQAKSGADVHCGFCGTRNVATATHCSQCMAELNEGTIRESGHVMGAHQQKPVVDVICSHCSTPNPGTAQSCSQCGAALPKLNKPAHSKAKPKQKRPSSRNSRFVMMAILGLFVVICIVLVVLSRRTEDVVGEVQAVNWKYSVVVE
ncbi:MAG: hypothetical protein GY805_07395, partial [Chloroflexi bacterium]|nr:hypothetical protein [Chloroflexota bacterium]